MSIRLSPPIASYDVSYDPLPMLRIPRRAVCFSRMGLQGAKQTHHKNTKFRHRDQTVPADGYVRCQSYHRTPFPGLVRRDVTPERKHRPFAGDERNRRGSPVLWRRFRGDRGYWDSPKGLVFLGATVMLASKERPRDLVRMNYHDMN